MSCKTRRLLFPLSEHTDTFPWDSAGNKAAKSGSGCLEESNFSPDYHLNPWQGWERDWENGCQLMPFKVTHKIGEKRQTQHS